MMRSRDTRILDRKRFAVLCILAAMMWFTLLLHLPTSAEILKHSSKLDGPWAQYNDLIIVPCHGVYMFPLNESADAITDAHHWILFSPFQFPVIRNHIQTASKLLEGNPRALVIFSGGMTEIDVPYSEAISYYRLGQYIGMPLERIFLEEAARDSYENLLFSLCRFFEVTGRYPHMVTVVGFDFKKDRIGRVHRDAIRFPPERLDYVGIDYPLEGPFGEGYKEKHADWLRQATQGEKRYASSLFQTDLYGCNDQLLQKRFKRDPFRRHSNVLGLQMSCPELSGLLAHCGKKVFSGPLPW
jgi:hypothetical protein